MILAPAALGKNIRVAAEGRPEQRINLETSQWESASKIRRMWDPKGGTALREQSAVNSGKE